MRVEVLHFVFLFKRKGERLGGRRRDSWNWSDKLTILIRAEQSNRSQVQLSNKSLVEHTIFIISICGLIQESTWAIISTAWEAQVNRESKNEKKKDEKQLWKINRLIIQSQYSQILLIKLAIISYSFWVFVGESSINKIKEKKKCTFWSDISVAGFPHLFQYASMYNCMSACKNLSHPKILAFLLR